MLEDLQISSKRDCCKELLVLRESYKVFICVKSCTREFTSGIRDMHTETTRLCE